MKSTTLFMIPIFLLLLVACEETGFNQTDTVLGDDDLLILAIQNATNKEVVDVTELPGPSLNIIDQDYVDYSPLVALIAPELGYEVSLGGHSYRIGQHRSTYFDLNGSELRAGGYRPGGGGEGYRPGGGNRDAECFSLVLPVTFLMPDGSNLTVENGDGYVDLRAWYDANSGTEGRPEIQFPVEIITADGETATINNAEELEEAYEDCSGGRGYDRDYCFELVLPVSYTMPDGSIITVEDEEGYGALRTWYTGKPYTNGRPELQFPVDVTFHDGSTLTLNSEEEMLEACTGENGGI